MAVYQDAYAQTALLMLLYFAIVFAHIFWMLEGRDNGMFEDNYGPGQDPFSTMLRYAMSNDSWPCKHTICTTSCGLWS